MQRPVGGFHWEEKYERKTKRVQMHNEGPSACFFLFLCTPQILSRCDIAVLQEVMDAKGKAVPALVDALNQ